MKHRGFNQKITCSSWLVVLTGLSLFTSAGLRAQTAHQYPFQNPSLSFERRADDRVSRMTLEEKVSQMQNSAAAVPHLGIQAYNWKNSIQVKS